MTRSRAGHGAASRGTERDDLSERGLPACEDAQSVALDSFVATPLPKDGDHLAYGATGSDWLPLWPLHAVIYGGRNNEGLMDSSGSSP